MYHILDLSFLGNNDTIAAFLVETSEGLVLIESGPHSTFEVLKQAIQAKGHEITDIKHVFLSHIHFDHAGAAWCFADLGATVYVHPAGAKHLASPEKLYNSAKMIYGEKMQMLWGDMKPIEESQIYTPSHGEKITVGETTFVAWHTPGHAVHHIAWQMDENLFAGDVAGVKIKGGIVVPPCPPPDINVEHWLDSITLMQSLNLQTLVLTHFGAVNEVQKHLDDLATMLNNWANWMLPQYQAGKKQEEIIPLFEKYVANLLKENGVKEIDIPKYQSANPAFMSVAGLMRYWHKRLNVAN
jgi:glyoxylase-like metal-dependent hydrolase (beta-lactamase superfamily II)